MIQPRTRVEMADLSAKIHADTMRLPLHRLVRDLNACLGTTLVAFIANVRGRQMPARWATDPSDSGHAEPRYEAKQRLQLAHQVYRTIEANEDEHVARQWLIGANPRFDGQTPAERIREFNAGSVLGALRAFIEDTGGD